ncbi:MAG: ABC transporter substrate-binding protein [Desulfovibrio sp.]|jgi:polar amino acid transport system substrate-binding protein|nr:ABC transporter substrate-binding protein [Desulfovibrio sp.]
MALKSFLFSCIAALFLTAGTAQAAPKYINGIDANYPPFAFLNDKLEPSGFDVESMNWIAQKMGFVVEHQAMDWNGIIPSLLAGKIDMVCSGMSISPERLERVNFSQPYWKIRKYLLIRQDSPLTASDLLTGKKTLGVQSGTNEAEYLKERLGRDGWNYALKFYESPSLAIQDLLNSRLDGAAIDSAPAEEAIHKGKKAIAVAGEFAEPDDFGVAVRKEDAALLETINKGYALLRQDPYWEELKAKYFNKEK